MKKITLIGLLMLFITNIQIYSQTEFWSDDFEDTGSPSSGVRTPSNNIGLGNPSTMYFKRTTNSQIDLSFGSYSDKMVQVFGQAKIMMVFLALVMQNKT